MRHALSLSVALLAASCGGSTDPGGPPPPPPSPQPAALVVKAGDGQDALPGQSVVLPPSVQVNDGSGRPVAGATVQFVVVSGGGTATGPAATSDALGIATAGGWTLGQTGDQALEARLGNLAPARFYAMLRPVLTEETFGPGGGTLEITKAGHPYQGLRLTVPTGAFAASNWRIGLAVNAPTPVLPAGFTIDGPPLRIETDQGRADRLMTIRIPVTRTPGRFPAFLLLDPVRNVMEMVPIIAMDNASITVAGSHFNAGLLIGPGSPASVGSARATSRLGYLGGSGYPISFSISALGFTTQILNYLADDFPAADVGSYAYPIGHGPGISLLGILGKIQNQPLGTAIKTIPPFGVLADTAALAALAIAAKRYYSGTNQVLLNLAAAFATALPPSRDSLTAINLRGGFLVSKLPQLMLFTENLSAWPTGNVGRSVFASLFGTANSTMWFASSTAPQIQGGLTLGPGGFGAKLVQQVADGPTFPADAVLPLGGSFLFPFDQYLDLVPRMVGALNATGSARDGANQALATEAGFADVTVELEGAAGGGWAPAEPTLVIRDTTASIRMLCQNCSNAIPQYPNPEQQSIAVQPCGPFPSRAPSLHLLNPFLYWSSFGPGSKSAQCLFDKLGIGNLEAAAMASIDPQLLQSQFLQAYRSVLPVHYPMLLRIFRIQPESQETVVNVPVPFDAPVASPPIHGYDIEWDFGDHSALVVTRNLSTTSHQYQKTGKYLVHAILKRSSTGRFPNLELARTTSVVVISPPRFAWQFQSAAIAATALPAGGIGIEHTDTLVQNFVNISLSTLQQAPANNLIFAQGDPSANDCLSVAFEQFPPGQVVDTGWVALAFRAILGSNCDLEPDLTASLTMGPLGNGPLVGDVVTSVNVPADVYVVPGGAINATMIGPTLQGTFLWRVRYSTGVALYTVTFSATQRYPKP